MALPDKKGAATPAASENFTYASSIVDLMESDGPVVPCWEDEELKLFNKAQEVRLSHRYCDRTRGRRHDACQGPDERYRRGLRTGVRRHTGVHDAGDPIDSSRRVRVLRGRSSRGEP